MTLMLVFELEIYNLMTLMLVLELELSVGKMSLRILIRGKHLFTSPLSVVWV